MNICVTARKGLRAAIAGGVVAVVSMAFSQSAACETLFTEAEVAAVFKTLHYGINKVYQSEPAESRPQGCVVFEVRILRDGTASTFRKVEGEFANAALLKKIQHFVLGRFSAPRDHLDNPQVAPYTICFNGDAGVSAKPVAEPEAPKPLPPPAEIMDNERGGVSNKEWLEQLMKQEGAPVENQPAASHTLAPQMPLQ